MTTLQLLNSTDIDQIDERIPELSGQIDLIDLQPKFLGSYSHVYRGYLRGHMVAVKVLVATGSLASMRRKVKRERIIWALLSHPNIIPLWGYTENDPRFGQFGALISPWCTKRDSGTWLEQEGYRSPLSHRIRLCYEVVNALEYLHTYNPILVHGDLKPGNILIDESCTAKVCDFGLIRTISGDSGLTTTTVHTGTDRYLAPEFFTSSEVIIPTPESDIYAFGCVGLKFLFLKDPYAHRKDNRFGWIFSDIKAGIMPSDKPNDLSLECNELWQLIEVCWDRDPTARTTARLARDFLSGFQTEGDIITDLPLGQAEPLHPGSMSSINEHLNKPDGLSIPIPSRAPVLVMRALYKFRAADAEQLSFKKGNVIEIIDQSDKALWKGRLDGREGYVPSNYMEMLAELPPNYITIREPPFIMRAIYTFERRDASDLPFNKGDIIEIIGLANRAWWRGNLNGKVGLVPMNHMEMPSELLSNNAIFQEPPFIVRAIYTYEQQDAGDLPFNKGDIITIIKMDNKDWGRGRLNGREGTVPMNYVKVMGEPPLNYLFFQEPPFRVRAIDTFEQGDVNDLPFNKGDIITIIGLANRYWWRGRLNGKEGFVPRKYVERLAESSSNHVTREAAFIMRAIHTFKPRDKDDLPFNEGDIIEITGLADENWRGRLHGREGLIPMDYVERVV